MSLTPPNWIRAAFGILSLSMEIKHLDFNLEEIQIHIF